MFFIFWLPCSVYSAPLVSTCLFKGVLSSCSRHKFTEKKGFYNDHYFLPLSISLW